MRMIRRVAKKLAGSTGLLSPRAVGGAGTATTYIGEITPCQPRPSHHLGARLNLLLPSINKRHYFGGIHTAITLYLALAKHFDSTRIVLLDSPPEEEALAGFPDHKLCAPSEDNGVKKQIVDFSDRYNRSLPVSRDEAWMATAWWTAYASQRLADWQRIEYGSEGKLVYLIQDFEPGFYPWSSQSAVALGTYRPDRDIAVFNTKLLSDYFARSGLSFARQHSFEPSLNEGLREALHRARLVADPRARRIVVYARPSTPRNAFELMCEGLRKWGWSDPTSASWEVVGVGELQTDLNLGPFKLRALGKMDIQAYAQLLSTSAVGVSLMISPHPSYPPLEMAAFGMGVITNSFANKDLSDVFSNIHSISVLSPEAIASSLTEVVAAWEQRQLLPQTLIPAEHWFLAKGQFDMLAERVRQELIYP